MDAFIRRAAGRVSAGERTVQPRDEQGRFAGGLAGGAGRGGVREDELDENATMNARIRAAAGRGPWPTQVATNGIVISE
jgi:hypothetical protein